MNIVHLQYLRSVLSEGSFTKAARHHGVSQAAISLAMQSLERRLGCVLFERQGVRKVANERARAVALAGELIEESVRRLPLANVQFPELTDGHVPFRVGLAPVSGLLYGSAIHRTLMDVSPGRMLSVFPGQATLVLRQLQAGNLDIAIVPLPRRFPLKNLQRRVLYVAKPMIYARVDHPLRHAQSLSQLVGADWVVAGEPGTPGNIIEEAFRVRGWAPPRIAVQCSDYRMLMSFIAGGDLLGVITNAALVTGDDQAATRPLMIRDGLPHYDVCVFWQAGLAGERRRVCDAVIRSLAGRAVSRREAA